MAKKAELLEQASKLGLKLPAKSTIAEIEKAIAAVDIKVAEETAEKADKPVAKAGKRSEKSLKEAKEKAEKEERKQKGDTTPQSADAEATVKKGPKPVTRPKIERRGKKYRKVAELVEKIKVYPLAEALSIITKTNPSKFDATVEMHVRLGVDARQADQNIRATVSLPNGTGKTIRVAVFAPETEHAKAKKAGADIVGDDDFLKHLDKENLNFDVLITIPQYMAKLGKYARLLGPRGLMPNPKSGSVTTDITKAVTEAKAGKVEYRVDKQSIVHLGIGKVSFGTEKLLENATTFLDSLKAQRPSSLKGVYVKSIATATSQGPSVKIENTIN